MLAVVCAVVRGHKFAGRACFSDIGQDPGISGPFGAGSTIAPCRPLTWVRAFRYVARKSKKQGCVCVCVCVCACACTCAR